MLEEKFHRSFKTLSRRDHRFADGYSIERCTMEVDPPRSGFRGAAQTSHDAEEIKNAIIITQNKRALRELALFSIQRHDLLSFLGCPHADGSLDVIGIETVED